MHLSEGLFFLARCPRFKQGQHPLENGETLRLAYEGECEHSRGDNLL